MRAEVLLLDLRLRRRLLLGYTLGMALYALVVVVLYPQFRNAASLNQLSGSAAAALFGVTGSLTSPTGWLDGNLYQNFLPLVMLLMTIGYGASCIAGQDEEGTLSLAVVLPLTRRGVLLQKVAALGIQAALLALATMMCVLVGRGFEVSVGVTGLAGISLGVALLGLDFGLLALAVGSWTGSRGLALAVSASLAAASYLASSLASVVPWIRPAKYASLFYWSIADGQLEKGTSIAAAGVLLLVAAVLLFLSLAAFRRLDLH